jgi:23S rRNA G2445 N2-methylase RlmL
VLDPMCGSGTIAIEAALMAAQRAPGAGREFSFQQWPSFEPGTWASVRASLRATRDDVPVTSTIVACDRDAGAVETTIANAERAGVAELIHTHVSALTASSKLDEVRDAPSGIVVTNPPYGVRVTSNKGLRDLYASLGNLMKGPLAPWDLAFLAAEDTLARATGLALDPTLKTKNGGIDVTLWQRRALPTVNESHLPTLGEQDT